MSSKSWASRDRKSTSKGYLKKLGKPFRKTNQKDSKQSREWSRLRKKLRRAEDQEAEAATQ
tara:strand:+ start:469 stop:651 length:183 start_codon:yes stop_codon:yes gene_type:complete